MQEFSAWCGKKNTKEPYEIDVDIFKQCFDDDQFGRDTRIFSDDDRTSLLSCAQYLKNIINSLKNGGTTLTQNGKEISCSIEDFKDFSREARISSNVWHAAAEIAQPNLLKLIGDDDRKKDDPNEKINYEDCRNCNALDIAAKKEKFYKEWYYHFRSQIEKGNLLPQYKEEMNNYKKEWQRRQKVYYELENLIQKRKIKNNFQ